MNRRLILLVSTVLLVGAAYILGWSTLFTVSSIEIKGASSQVSSGIVTGEKLARVEPRAVAAKLETLDWVSKAKVSRNWINGKVTIDLIERTPIAIYNNKVIDSMGKSFVQRGPASTQLVQIQAGDLTAATRAVTFFTTLPEDLKSALTVVKVRSTGALVLVVNNAGKNLEIRWGTDGEIKRVDVSAPHAPIVK